MDEDDFLGAKETLRKDERPHDIVGDHAARIADDMCIAMSEAKHFEDVHAAVHACDDGQVTSRGEVQALVCELPDESRVVGEKFVGVRLKRV